MKSLLIPFIYALSLPALAQVDFSGEWEHPGMFGHEDVPDRGAGPEIGDYMGLPLNAAGLRKAESYSGSWLSVPEHQCTPHPAAYQTWGPNTMVVGKTYEPVQRVVNAITLDGTFGLDRVVWMDGREHPPESALHTFTGYSTGHWEGDALVVKTTHMKAGWLRRNGAPTSEHATMTEYYERFGDYMLVTTIIDDPVYLSEPFIRTTEYTMVTRPVPVLGYPFTRNDGQNFYKCFPSEETTADKYYVPHFLPGENFLLDEFADKHKVSRDMMSAGSASMFPEFAEQIEEGKISTKLPTPALPDYPTSAEEIQSLQVRDNIWLITGAGANITVQVGDEGVLVVDTGREEMAARVREEIRSFAGDKPIRYIINTQWHEDHTGGNVLLSDEGQRSAILAHENVGLRLAEADAEAGFLVMDTYYTEKKMIHFNGEVIEIIKAPNAHTDGDSIVFFRGSDVVVAGDLIDTAAFPHFRAEEDGSLVGVIAGLNRILDITVAEYRSQGGTIVIPGHGRLYDETDVAEYRDMASIIRDRVKKAVEADASLRQFRASEPVLDYAAVFGAKGSDWTSDDFIEAAYREFSDAQ